MNLYLWGQISAIQPVDGEKSWKLQKKMVLMTATTNSIDHEVNL